jgi:plasmid replication initiation protein
MSPFTILIVPCLTTYRRHYFYLVETKDKIIFKHSSIIQVSGDVSLMQRKVFNTLLMDRYKHSFSERICRVTIRDIFRYLDLQSEKNYKFIKDCVGSLVKTTVEYNILNKDKTIEWGVLALLAGCRIKRSVIEYEFSEMIMEKIQNPSMYARINLSLQNKFSRYASLALYELCLDYSLGKTGKGRTPVIPIDVFRGLMGIGEHKYYSDFRRLNQKIIKPTIQEINEHTDLIVTCNQIQEGRKVTALQFEMRPNPNRTVQLTATPISRLKAPAKNVEVEQWIAEHPDEYKEICARRVEKIRHEQGVLYQSLRSRAVKLGKSELETFMHLKIYYMQVRSEIEELVSVR